VWGYSDVYRSGGWSVKPRVYVSWHKRSEEEHFAAWGVLGAPANSEGAPPELQADCMGCSWL